MTTKATTTEAIVIERTFNAPVARVWQALTDVDQMRQWYFDLKEFRPEVGFEFGFVVQHNGNAYDQPMSNHGDHPAKENGLHLAIRRPRRLLIGYV